MDPGLRVKEFRTHGLGFKTSGFEAMGLRIQGSKLKVLDFGTRVRGLLGLSRSRAECDAFRK